MKSEYVVLFEFPWQFGFGSFALYLIGIAQTLADVRSILSLFVIDVPLLIDSTFFL